MDEADSFSSEKLLSGVSSEKKLPSPFKKHCLKHVAAMHQLPNLLQYYYIFSSFPLQGPSDTLFRTRTKKNCD